MGRKIAVFGASIAKNIGFFTILSKAGQKVLVFPVVWLGQGGVLGTPPGVQNLVIFYSPGGIHIRKVFAGSHPVAIFIGKLCILMIWGQKPLQNCVF